MKNIQITRNLSSQEEAANADLLGLFISTQIPNNEILSNLGLFMNRQRLSRLLFIHEIYRLILPVHGIIVEFGTRWGQNLVTFSSLRGIYEPFNYTRKIVGFDTFSGFPGVTPEDGTDSIAAKGSYSVTDGYDAYLGRVLDVHEQFSPIAHIKKHEIIRGDAVVECARYLKKHPETIIALAYFDFDIYEPTKKCLELIRGHLTKGSVLGFDELMSSTFPGETIAVREALGLDKSAIRRFPFNPVPTYMVIE